LATKKISALTTGTTANPTDKIPIERSGSNYYITPAMFGTHARVGRSTDQSISNNTVTAISFDTERTDTGSFWVIGSPTRLTIAVAGTYRITGHVEWNNSTTTGRRQLAIRLNGADLLAVAEDGLTDRPNRVCQSVSTEWTFAAADYVELRAYQTSGSSININTNDFYSPEFSISRIGL
jgi:hypothetical protein